MESFRTGARVVRINVNDDGYCVELQVSNDAWIKAFYEYLKDIQEKNIEHEQAVRDADVDTVIEHLLEFDEEIKAGFIKLFGDDSYKETFGSDLVGVEYIAEFLEACIPFIEKRLDERKKAYDKYSPSKTGGAR